MKLAQEIGTGRPHRSWASQWIRCTAGRRRCVKAGWTRVPAAAQPETAMSLANELTALRKQVKKPENANRRLKEENEFLAEASAFFAASRRKSARNSE